MTREPIAIIGMSCRFAGGIANPDQLWQTLSEGRCVIGGLPADRGWDPGPIDPGHCGHAPAVDVGGFLTDVAGFDADFFGISPREALVMDPQQRLLLQVAWETIEHAMIDPHTLRRSATGVFLGASYQEYASRCASLPTGSEPYVDTGAAIAVGSGRIAYYLGLESPALTVDTGCSSSLVAIHLACQSLWRTESTMALAGGAAVLSAPTVLAALAGKRVLSPAGRCRAFDDAADGMVTGEGVGLILLQRLAAARDAGNPVLAVIRGSALAQDGAGDGLTAPSVAAQRAVIRAALADAGLSTRDVDVVEAHGAGTPLGDKVEAQALLDTYGQDRATGAPLLVGTLKANIGHPWAAAGVAGVIKTVLALRHGTVPPVIDLDQPTSTVDWSAGAVRVLTEALPWPDTGRPRRAGVSSFGISGTNAHLILEQATELVERSATPARPAIGRMPWVLSAKSDTALRAQAARLRESLVDNPAANLADIGYSLATTRARFKRRAVVLGADRDQFLDRLGEVAVSPEISVPTSPTGGVVFVFPGQGSQWPGMALDLLDESPEFAASMRRCQQALRPHVDWTLVDVLRGGPGAPSLSQVDVVQPTLFAVMVSLAAVWRSYGVEPDAVIGHSQGELAAACVAGALSLEDATRVVALRSRALAALAGTGAMASVALPVDRLADRVARAGLSVAAVNGPASTVVSGDAEPLDALLDDLDKEGVRVSQIPVDYASHSAHVDGLRAEIAALSAATRPRDPEVPVLSTVTGRPLDAATLRDEYWYQNLRRTVRFADAAADLLDRGHRVFIELSPHPVLLMGLEGIADERGIEDLTAVGSLRRSEGGLDRFHQSLAQIHIRGVDVNWGVAFDGAQRTGLPTYPFDTQRYWLDQGGSSPWQANTTLRPLPPARRSPVARSDVLDLICGHIATLLGYPLDRPLDRHTPLRELGFDSTMAMEFRDRLAADTGLRLPATLVYEHPTPAAVAKHVASRLLPTEEATADPVTVIETLLRDTPPTDPGRSEILRRLRRLLDIADATGGDPAGDLAGGPRATAEAASDDEMFALIDNFRD